jgi:hypothetical protein
MKTKSLKINTLTFHGVINHGAVLQAYALQKYLLNNGYQSQLINYQPWYFIKQVYRPAKGIKKSILKYRRLLKFKGFTKQHLNVTNKLYFTATQFKNINNCDAIVCGSDQIWNKAITNKALDPVFFLEGTNGLKKIAYAASAGANRLSHENGIKNLISNFDHIGVRENHLKEDLNNFDIDCNAQMVLDPTLLLCQTDYDEIASTSLVPKHKFIVSYEVCTDDTRIKYNEFVIRLKELLKLPVYHIGDKPIEAADENILNISPSDWVGFIKEADFVVTNSFHGSAFAINFRKPLFMLSHLDGERNARPLNFLRSIKMETCFIDDVNRLNQESIDESHMERDYTEYNKLVNFSKQFLLDAITR